MSNDSLSCHCGNPHLMALGFFNKKGYLDLVNLDHQPNLYCPACQRMLEYNAELGKWFCFKWEQDHWTAVE